MHILIHPTDGTHMRGCIAAAALDLILSFISKDLNQSSSVWSYISISFVSSLYVDMKEFITYFPFIRDPTDGAYMRGRHVSI